MVLNFEMPPVDCIPLPQSGTWEVPVFLLSKIGGIGAHGNGSQP